MAFWDKNLKQDVIYWASPVPDGYGSYTYDDPIQLKGRWEDFQETVQNEDNEEKKARGRIFLKQAVDRKGFLALGTLADVSLSDTPETYNGAFMIFTTRFIPSLKNNKTLYYAIL